MAGQALPIQHPGKDSASAKNPTGAPASYKSHRPRSSPAEKPPWTSDCLRCMVSPASAQFPAQSWRALWSLRSHQRSSKPPRAREPCLPSSPPFLFLPSHLFLSAPAVNPSHKPSENKEASRSYPTPRRDRILFPPAPTFCQSNCPFPHPVSH